MTYFAHVLNGIVQQVIVADKSFITTFTSDPQNWVEMSDNLAGIGYTYNITNKIFAPPIQNAGNILLSGNISSLSGNI